MCSEQNNNNEQHLPALIFSLSLDHLKMNNIFPAIMVKKKKLKKKEGKETRIVERYSRIIFGRYE